MKVLYITFNVSDITLPGVAKKIRYQAGALSRQGAICDVLFVINNRLEFYGAEMQNVTDVSADEKDEYLYKLALQYDAVYYRWAGADKTFNKLEKKLAKTSVVQMIEFPVYPVFNSIFYNAKQSFLKHKYFKMIYSLVGAFYAQYILVPLQMRRADMAVVCSSEVDVYNKKTIHIDNAIDVNSISCRNVAISGNTIKLLGVANIASWHAYDRIIEGIYKYRTESRKIEFYVVGDGGKKAELEDKVKEYELQDSVFFVGKKYGKELDYYFDVCDIAVGSLGLHRLKMRPSSLKSREYAARGIPFMITNTETFECDTSIQSFVYYVPDTDEAIDIPQLINWYSKLDVMLASERLRKYAEDKCSWDTQMCKIYLALMQNTGA